MLQTAIFHLLYLLTYLLTSNSCNLQQHVQIKSIPSHHYHVHHHQRATSVPLWPPNDWRRPRRLPPPNQFYGCFPGKINKQFSSTCSEWQLSWINCTDVGQATCPFCKQPNIVKTMKETQCTEHNELHGLILFFDCLRIPKAFSAKTTQ